MKNINTTIQQLKFVLISYYKLAGLKGEVMVPNFSTYLYHANNSLTWNINWISEFESVWSVFNKIMIANNAAKKDFFALFGSSELLKQKTIQGSKNHNIYLLSAFDDTSFIEKLGFSLKTYNRDLIYQLSGFLSNSGMIDFKRGVQEYRFWRNSLTFCLVCLQDGYHSILHQFALIHECPFHGTPLHDHCPSCMTEIPYELSDRYFEAPFVCLCGHHFRHNQNDISSIFQWRKYSISDIQDTRVKRWVNLCEDDQAEISRIYLYRHIDFKFTPQMLEILLGAIQSESSILNTGDFYQISSPKNLFKRKSKQLAYIYSKFKKQPTIKLLHDESKKNPIALSDNEYIKLNEKINKNLQETWYQTIHSLGKHFRKTILKNHNSCIHRFVNVKKQVNTPNPPICPYAYAYVMWKQKLLKIDYYYDVDNRPYYPDRFSNNPNLTSVPDWDPLIHLIREYLDIYPIQKNEYHDNMKWVVSHLIGYVSNHYFYELLSDAGGLKKLANNYEDPFILRGSTLAFRFPKNINQPFQMLWNKKPDVDFTQIQCPYPTQKLKKKKISEVSHHPRRLAVNRADQTKSQNYIYI